MLVCVRQILMHQNQPEFAKSAPTQVNELSLGTYKDVERLNWKVSIVKNPL